MKIVAKIEDFRNNNMEKTTKQRHVPGISRPTRREAQEGVGMRISTMRRSKGWSQAVFAEMCGIDRTLLGVIERGNQNLGLRALLPIAATLNTTVADLFAGVA